MGPPEIGLQVVGVSVTFPNASSPTLHQVSLEVAPQEIVAILGPSGSGKSTLLRVIAGLTTPQSGNIILNGRDITQLPTHTREIGMMFQGSHLFPHMNVAKNIAYALRLRGIPKDDQRRRVEELLTLVGLTGFEGRDPTQLSGGEVTRVALARSLASSPQLLLLDEPLAGLDKELHDSLAPELRRTLNTAGIGAILVTHDLQEANMIADRVVRLRELSIVRDIT